jgi:hypothetical protein
MCAQEVPMTAEVSNHCISSDVVLPAIRRRWRSCTAVKATENSRYLDVASVTMPDVHVPEQSHG